MVKIHEDWIEDLVRCKRVVKGRDFSRWNVEQLISEALREFVRKYGDG